MSYYKKKFNNKFDNKPRAQRWDNKPSYDDSFPTKPESEGGVDVAISTKALSGLPNSSYSVKADPYSASLPTSSPYNILAPFLKTVGGNYRGDDNIDGGNIQQYANSSTSKYLHCYDSFRMKIDLNYRYLPVAPTTSRIGTALVNEMRKSIAEAVSVLQSTTFTSLAINNFAVETDMPMGTSAETTNISNTADAINAYTSSSDVLYALSIYYQTFLQEALSVMNWHNSFRLKQGTAIRDAWGREVPTLNGFFGLMNKKSFLSLLNSINLSFEGEYVDKDFMAQVNYLTLMPSRRSNSMFDPVLELQAKMAHPTKFKVYVIGSSGKIVDLDNKPLYDDALLGSNYIPASQTTPTFISFWTAADQIKDFLSLESVKRWARGVYSVEGTMAGTDNARYNYIKDMFDIITNAFVYFKPKFSDYRECLDIMTRTGAISWAKGFRPSITESTDAQLFQNLIVDDIYKMVMSGNNALSYNDKTKRWMTYSQWNMYTGTPEYDSKQGGAFITFSAKDYAGATTQEQIEYLPIMFNPTPSAENTYVVGISRSGDPCNVTYEVTNINTDKVLSRLVPLDSQSDLNIRVPYLTWTLNDKLTAIDRSLLYKTLTQIFGICKIAESSSTSDTALDPDLISVYQIEISDITNSAITYARANAPFRGTTSDQGLLGFFGVSKTE